MITVVTIFSVFSLSPWECTVRGHHEHLFGDMVDTYN